MIFVKLRIVNIIACTQQLIVYTVFLNFTFARSWSTLKLVLIDPDFTLQIQPTITSRRSCITCFAKYTHTQQLIAYVVLLNILGTCPWPTLSKKNLYI